MPSEHENNGTNRKDSPTSDKKRRLTRRRIGSGIRRVVVWLIRNNSKKENVLMCVYLYVCIYIYVYLYTHMYVCMYIYI